MSNTIGKKYLATFFLALCISSVYAQNWQSVSFMSGGKRAIVTYCVQYRTSELGTPVDLFAAGSSADAVQNIQLAGSNYGRLDVSIKEVRYMQRKEQIFLNLSCFERDHEERSELEIITDNLPFRIKENGNDLNKLIKFSIRNNGSGDLRVQLGRLIDEDWSRAIYGPEIRVQYAISGLSKDGQNQPLELSLEEVAWNRLDRNSVSSICSFLDNYPKCAYSEDAIALFNSLDYRLWKDAVSGSSIQSYQSYLYAAQGCKRYAAYVHLAESEIRKLEALSVGKAKPPQKKKTPPLVSPPKESSSWEKFLESNPDESQIAAFINLPNNPDRENAIQLLLQKFPALKYSERETESGHSIKIENPYFHPRYKDVSLSYGLSIDPFSWHSNYSLDIEFVENGKFSLLVKDTLGREVVVPLGSTFDVDFATTDSAYVLRFFGGKKPYTIELYNEESRHLESFQTSEREFALNKAKLASQNFKGEYLVRVGYANGPDLEELTGSIYIQKSQSYLLPLLILFILLAISVGIYMGLNNIRRNRRTIFSN